MLTITGSVQPFSDSLDVHAHAKRGEAGRFRGPLYCRAQVGSCVTPSQFDLLQNGTVSEKDLLIFSAIFLD